MDKEIRLLAADEIEVRVQSVKQTKNNAGTILLLYQDARAAMRLLDEVYGVTGWQRSHEVINGRLFCNIDIWDDDKKQWIRKQDVGVESYTEKEKGQASDAFKRTAVNVGIGRELYTAPFIWINLEKSEYYQKDSKTLALSPTVKFKVKSIEYNEKREISKLEIIDTKHRVRYPSKGTTAQNNNTGNNQNIQENANNNVTNTSKCVKCGSGVSANVSKFSKEKYKKVLCMNCQKLEK